MRRFQLGLLAGCYDCFHPGHAWVLTEAAKHCESLVALVASDESIRLLKHREPVDSWKVRAANVLKACPAVSRVEPIEDHGRLTLSYWTGEIKPDLLIVTDCQMHIPDKVQAVREHRVPLLVLPRSPIPISTTEIVSMLPRSVPLSSVPSFEPHWKPTDEAVLENQRYGSVRHRVVLKPDGTPSYDQPQLLAPPSAACLPIDSAGRIGLISIYRHAVLRSDYSGRYPDFPQSDFGAWQWEAPRGFCDPDEDVEQAAVRELKEETALDVQSVSHVGQVVLDSAILPMPMELFLASVSGEAKCQSSEVIREMRFFTLAELASMMANKEIRCGVTLSLIGHCLSRLVAGDTVPPWKL